ncbi:hypothetical protein NCAS_0A13440 [Naumovozyma castellii]|uniref:EXS domain-containing protein n=1 Tax=Naumovozyma castellii TaxID=27288 RepID=G0V8V3_NAUCA|nr:hypothetical protein NCAS_0A13440 [Naumovozyma castellii CBS 4309]CCC67902.1 hypothetical protein NCAS_0A13440 [Naumovozyma castellii CBS 4309]
MKFGDHLRESIIPEWKDKYIDYKSSKKRIKHFRAKWENQSIYNDPVFQKKSTYSTTRDLRSNNNSQSNLNLNRQASNGNIIRSTNSSSSSLASSLRVYSPLLIEIIHEFMENWIISIQLTKCNEFYNWLLNDSRKKFKILQNQVHLFNIQKRLFNDAANSISSSYGSLMTSATSDSVTTSLIQSIKDTLHAHRLLPSYPQYSLKQLIFNNTTSDTESQPLMERETFNPEDQLLNNLNNNTSSAKSSLDKSAKLLSDAILEFYLFLQLIKSYRDLNVTGFRKIVKKFDKTFQTNELNKFMAFAKQNFTIFKHIDPNIKLMTNKMKQISSYQPIIFDELIPSNEIDDPILWWESKVKDWYVNQLTNSPKSMKKNNKKLKKLIIQYSLNEQMVHRNNRAIIQMTIAAWILGISSTSIANTIYLSFMSGYTSYTHKILFPIWGGWYMVLLISLLIISNCFIWHKSEINYRFIMFGEIKARSGTQFYNNDFATTRISLNLYFLSFFILPLSICALLSFHNENLFPYAIIYPLIATSLFIAPKAISKYILPYWNKLKEIRVWILTTFIRLSLSGLYPVEFGDFFLGDIICSLTYSMSDIAMFFCIYFSDKPSTTCGSSHSITMGILSCLPNYWRMMQCFRRWADSADWFPHLLNAIKYGLGVAYNGTLCAYRLSNHERGTTRNTFIIVAALNALITSVWDLTVDWSLLQPDSNNWLLRNDLYLAGKKDWETGQYSRARKSFYYIAMVWDVLIRFQWIVYAIAPQTIQQNAITSFILATTEIIRRCIWVIIRVENEHVANVHLFRVTGNAPLPYPVNVQTIALTKPTFQIGEEERMAENLDQQALGNLSFNVSYDENAMWPPYRTLARRRTTTFAEISKSIPWVHATDFQRPTTLLSSNESKYDDDDEDAISDSESDSDVASK